MKITEKQKELVLYILFGAMTTLVNFVVFLIFDHILGEKLYLISNLIAWIIAVAFAFVVNKFFVFRAFSSNRRTVFAELIKFVSARIFSLLVEEVGLFVLVDLLNMSNVSIKIIFNISGAFIAKCTLAVMVIVMNYFFSKFLIFKEKSQETKNT